MIRTSYGFHIIHVEAKQEARLKPLDEVKAEIEPILKKQKARRRRRVSPMLVETLAQDRRAGQSGAGAQPQRHHDRFGRARRAAAGHRQRSGIHERSVGAKKNDPPAVAPTPVGYVVYQVTEIQPPQTPTFEQIKDKVEQQFKDQRAQELLEQKTQELADRAHSEHDLEKAAKEVGATVKTSDLVSRSSQMPELGAMSWAGQRGVQHEARRNQRGDSRPAPTAWC